MACRRLSLGYVPGRKLLNNHLSNFTQPSQPTPLKKTSPFQAQQKPNRKGVYYDLRQSFKPFFEFWRSKLKGSQSKEVVYNKCGKFEAICVYYSNSADISITLESNFRLFYNFRLCHHVIVVSCGPLAPAAALPHAGPLSVCRPLARSHDAAASDLRSGDSFFSIFALQPPPKTHLLHFTMSSRRESLMGAVIGRMQEKNAKALQLISLTKQIQKVNTD